MSYNQPRKQSSFPSLKKKRPIAVTKTYDISKQLPRNKEYLVWHDPGTRAPYWIVKPRIYEDGLIWGFDSTSVTKQGWLNFLEEFGFRKVACNPVEREGPSDPQVYLNKDNVVIVLEHEDFNEIDEVDLGGMRFEAPRPYGPDMHDVLEAFRGPKKLRMDGHGGIVVCSKQETPNDGGFI